MLSTRHLFLSTYNDPEFGVWVQITAVNSTLDCISLYIQQQYLFQIQVLLLWDFICFISRSDVYNNEIEVEIMEQPWGNKYVLLILTARLFHCICLSSLVNLILIEQYRSVTWTLFVWFILKMWQRGKKVLGVGQGEVWVPHMGFIILLCLNLNIRYFLSSIHGIISLLLRVKKYVISI